jgi:YHS domain-containing protein
MNTTVAIIDPMCGRYLRERDPRFATEIEGTIHYFCSLACKKQFDRGVAVVAERMVHAGQAPH